MCIQRLSDQKRVLVLKFRNAVSAQSDTVALGLLCKEGRHFMISFQPGFPNDDNVRIPPNILQQNSAYAATMLYQFNPRDSP